MIKPHLRKQEGFTYLALLFAIAMLGTALAGAGVLWSTAQQREKEEQLLFVGGEIRKAIGIYYQKTPGTLKRYPPTLAALIQDNRQASLTRYLRRVYRDPVSAEADWVIIVAPGGGVMGVHSASEKRPIKRSFDIENQDFIGTKKYSDWHFVYSPPTEVGAAR